jgi:signal transduction histidine kinase
MGTLRARAQSDPLVRHPIAGGILTATGVASLVLVFLHVTHGVDPPAAVLLGVVPPALLSLVILFVGVWIGTSSLDRQAVLRILTWAIAGAAVGGGTTAMYALYQSTYGVGMVHATYAIAAAGDGGMVAGFVVAAYDYRARARQAALQQTSQMLDTIRRVTQAAGRAESRAALESEVCTHIAAGEPYVSAWIGEVDPETGEVVPREMPAAAEPYFEDMPDQPPADSEDPGATIRAIRTDGVQVVDDVLTHPAYEPWHETFREYDITSSLAVSLTYDGERYGVLTVFADRPDAFSGRERRIFAELGETVAHAMATLAYRERLEGQNQQLEALNQLLRHDIRNDMNVIMAYGQRLAAGEGDAHEADRLLEKADHVVELTRTAGELAETTQTGGEDLEPIRIDDVLRRVIEDVDASFPAASVTVGDLPAVEVSANEMLSSVFDNLLHNAVQHHDGDEPHVAVTAAVEDDTVRVEVADDGPGIPDAMKAQVFEHGERGAESSGTGLGLYLVRTLVDRYAGEVAVVDNEPRGTVFTVRLPRWDRAEPVNEGLPAGRPNAGP